MRRLSRQVKLRIFLTMLLVFVLGLPGVSSGASQCFVSDMTFFGSSSWVDAKVVVNPHNGNTYGLFETNMTWAEAKKFAEDIGGHLVTITSSQEQDFVNFVLEQGQKNYYWIGATDEDTEGKWTWVPVPDRTEASGFSNWADGEPNDWGGENYAAARNDGYWFDLYGARTELKAYNKGIDSVGCIVEWEFSYRPFTTPPSVYDYDNKHTYALYDAGDTWKKSNEKAKEIFAHLATITTNKEAQMMRFLLATGEMDFYWLGGEKTTGQWKWVTGEPFSNTLWAPGEPNNYGGEKYLMVYGTEFDPSGNVVVNKWNDQYGNWVEKPNNFGYILEWDK